MADSKAKATATELFAELELVGPAEHEAWTAFDSNQQGTIRCARKALGGRSPAGLFLHMIRQGEHMKPGRRQGKRRTGWRWVRGTHGGTFVPDDKGTDHLPAGHEQ